MRALVISGGGSKGAFAGGVAEHLIKDIGNSYDIFVGTSTGSLLAPLLASNNIDRAFKVYTSISAKDIFSECPFVIKEVNGEFKTRFNHWTIIKQFLKRAPTLGTSLNLRKLITKTFSEQDYNAIKANGKAVVVSVSNLTNQEMEYKSSNDYGYEDFCDWIWASANLLPFMSLVKKEGCEYGDGGYGDFVPIQKAIDAGASIVDVIVLEQKEKSTHLPSLTNPFQSMLRTYDFMFNQIGKDDLIIGKLAAAYKNVEIRIYHTPRLLTENSLIFDAKLMRKWWIEGRSIFKENQPSKVVLTPNIVL